MSVQSSETVEQTTPHRPPYLFAIMIGIGVIVASALAVIAAAA